VTLALHHKADGAKFWRVSKDNGITWEAWKPYQAETTITVPKSPQLDIVVQYWADGSAAYFSRQRVTP
jgi:hypothetical protein